MSTSSDSRLLMAPLPKQGADLTLDALTVSFDGSRTRRKEMAVRRDEKKPEEVFF